MSQTSLRRVAAASTLTSHHCEVLLRSLAARPAAPGTASHSAELLRAAAAGRARDGWFHVAKALDHVTTDTPGYLSPAADETRNLALWTGRLAYASPDWTPASGPAHPPRDPENLAPRPGDVSRVITAVHYASETLAQLARADSEQIRTAAGADGR